MNIKIEILRNPSIRGYDVWKTNELSDGTVQLCKPFNLEFMDDDEVTENLPSIQLKGRDANNFLQAFAEGLENSGFKTPELQNLNKEIRAITYHLEDMRRLVFKNSGK